MEKKKKILYIAVIFAVILVCITSFNIFKQKNRNNIAENLRADTYTKVEIGDEAIDNTAYVTFDAFYLRDLDGDGYAEKLRGTCKEIGTEDTLYMDLNVLTNGTLKDAKITIDGKNFYLATAIVKDNVISQDYISSNTKEIVLNDVTNGTQKLIFGIVKSGDYSSSNNIAAAIGNDTTKYSVTDNSVTLTGIHVAEDGTETPVSKTVYLTNDWYGTTRTVLDASYSNQEYEDTSIIDEEAGVIRLDLKISTRERDKQLILAKNYVEGELPLLSGYAPSKVTLKTSGATLIYDDTTRKFVIEKQTEIDENGIATTTISRDLIYNLTIEYPIEAYQKYGSTILTIEIPVKSYFEGYNNDNEEFVNPYVSNVAEDVLNIIYRKPIPGDPYIELFVGKKVWDEYSQTTKYVVSKDLPQKLYNQIEVQKSEKDRYTVEWFCYVGESSQDLPLVVNEYALYDSDRFLDSEGVYSSMDEYIANVGIYFKNAHALLGSQGYINVFNNDTDELIYTFTSENWNNYNESNPYMYDEKIKHIRVETSGVNKGSYLDIYNVKEIDDNRLISDYTEEEFEKLKNIYSHVEQYVGGQDGGTDMNFAEYETPYSIAILNINPEYISNNETQESVKLNIASDSGQFNTRKWQNGEFLIKYPSEIIDVKINSVVSKNVNVEITGIETYEENGYIYTKVYTSNTNETDINIEIDADITANPLTSTMSRDVEMYFYNPLCHNYDNETRNTDIYDINNDENVVENVGYVINTINIIAPSNLITSQVGSDYDNKVSIVIAPQTAIVEKVEENTTAKVSVNVSNNYSNTISEIKVIGKIPFEGNSYQLNGESLGSTFDTTMTESGIVIPEELKQYATIYYSYNEVVTEDLNDSQNGWTTTPEDMSKVKTYLVDFGKYIMSKGETVTFNYEINIPGGLDYNEVSYADHAVYYYLDTDEGKLKTQTEPNKLGFMIADNYNLKITKYEKGTEKLLSGVTFNLEDTVNGETKIATTYNNGIAEFKDLYVEREYIIREIKTNSNHVLMEEEIKIIAHIVDGNLTFEVLEGEIITSFTNVEINSENEDVVNIALENEVKYNLELSKTESESGKTIEGVKFELTDGSSTKKYITNSEGKVLLSLLEPNIEYTLTEIEANGYYLKSPITFVMERDINNEFVFNIINGEINVLSNVDISGEIPSIKVGITNEIVPTYSLKVKKVEKDTDTVLQGTQFRITGENKDEVYTTDENGYIVIENLYEFIEGKNTTGEYTLQEIFPTDGYVLNETALVFKAQKDSENNLKIQIISGTIKEAVEEVTVDTTDVNNPIINITIENEPIFTLTKVDKDTREPLAGVQFKITDMDGNAVTDVNGNEIGIQTTDENGKIRISLPTGLYKAEEVSVLEGYKTPDLYTGIGIGQSQEGQTAIERVWENTENERIMFDGMDIVEGGFVAVSSDGKVARFLNDGTAVWINRDILINYNNVKVFEDMIIAVGYNGVIAKYNLEGKLLGYRSLGEHELRDLEVMEDGFVVVSEDGLVAKCDFNGNVIWSNQEKIYEWEDLAITSEGIVTVAETGQVAMLDFDGIFIWENVERTYEYVNVAAVSDGVIVAAHTGQVVKYSLDGTTILWENVEKDYEFEKIYLTDDGIIICSSDDRVAKYDYNGNFIVRTRIDEDVAFECVICLEDGSIISGGSAGKLVKFNSDLEVEWINREFSYSLFSLAELEDGFVAASSGGQMTKYDFYGNIVWENSEGLHSYIDVIVVEDGIIGLTSGRLVKFDFNGNLIWKIDRVTYAYYDCVAVDDGIIAVGYSGVVKYDFSGNIVWENLEKANDYRAVALVEDGIIAVGYTGIVAKYNFNGTLVWENTEETYYYRDVIVLEDCIKAIASSGRLAEYTFDGQYVGRVKENLNQYDMMAMADFQGGIAIIDYSGRIVKTDYDGIVQYTFQDNKSFNDVIAVGDKLIATSESGVAMYQEYYTEPEIPASQNIIVENERIEYNITTEVVGGNGQILGEGYTPYEKVKHGDDSIKDIIATPDSGYKVVKITVNGEEIQFTENDDGTVELSKFVNMTSDKHVVVEFSNTASDIIVHHYIKDTTTSVAPDEYYTGNVGEEYTTSPKLDLEEYELVKNDDGSYQIPDNASGTYIETTQEITYYYELKPLQLIVHHYIDGTEDSVAPDENSEGTKGQSYTTNPAVPPVLDDRYELVTDRLPDNASGTLEEPVTEVTYYYTLIKGTITVTKVDKKDESKVLEGATFKLEKLDDDGNVDTKFTTIESTTGTDGKAKFTELLVGKYRITEVKAPEGYELTTEPIDVEINYEQKDVNITASDRLKLDLPETGGVNYTIAISGIGLAVMLVAVLIKKFKSTKEN